MLRAIAPLALLVLVFSIVGSAVTSMPLNVTVETFETPVYAEVYNASVQVPANGSLQLSISLPKNWTPGAAAAIHVVAVNITSTISLSASDANGTTIATATIIPLSTEYHTTLPPETRSITLANPGDMVAEGRLVVYVESVPVKFQLELPSEAHVQLGTATYVHGRITQLEGPPGWLWAQWNKPLPLNVTVYWGHLENGTPPSKGVPASTDKWTSGAGWSENFTILLDAGRVTQEDKFTVQVAWYYSDEAELENATSQLVATINLAGEVSDQPVIAGVPVDSSKGKIAVAVLVFIVVMSGVALAVSRGWLS